MTTKPPLTELEIFRGFRDFRGACESEFEAIHRKLDRLDEAIRGNGRPGIQLRLDRLESSERMRSKIIWTILGVAITLAVTTLWHQVFGG